MPCGRTGLHGRVDLVGLALADEVADRRRGDQHLGGDDPPTTVGGLREGLADHALQGHRQLGAYLLLLVRREHVDDAVDRLGGVLGVQGREDQVAGLGRGQRHRDGLQVAHLADQDDVGVLAQHVLERVGEGPGVLADLALVDQAALVLVQELDRVLDGHDVVLAGPVGQVDQRRERRRLAGAGGAGHEHEATRQAGEVRDRRRDAEGLQRLDLEGDDAERRTQRVALLVHVHAEPGPARHAGRRSRARGPPRTSPAGSA